MQSLVVGIPRRAFYSFIHAAGTAIFMQARDEEYILMKKQPSLFLPLSPALTEITSVRAIDWTTDQQNRNPIRQAMVISVELD